MDLRRTEVSPHVTAGRDGSECPCGFRSDECQHCTGATVYREFAGRWQLDDLPGNHVAFYAALGMPAEFFPDVRLAHVPAEPDERALD